MAHTRNGEASGEAVLSKPEPDAHPAAVIEDRHGDAEGSPRK